ncbi:unnamed protein product [Linum tenue]|uniref:Response regulatory domain-containing protein n=1 Tax=Linum tenue TaxID=586396 RepID=A0AAV0KNU6_9ROSI|nr:unnamed protein product [Linum tenue]
MHKMMLTRLDIEVEVAANGKAAVDLHLAGASFHLILMDLQMPLIDGSQATKELRGMGVASPIVGVTAACDGGPEKTAFLASGLTDCVSKPLTINKIATYLPAPKNPYNN